MSKKQPMLIHAAVYGFLLSIFSALLVWFGVLPRDSLTTSLIPLLGTLSLSLPLTQGYVSWLFPRWRMPECLNLCSWDNWGDGLLAASGGTIAITVARRIRYQHRRTFVDMGQRGAIGRDLAKTITQPMTRRGASRQQGAAGTAKKQAASGKSSDDGGPGEPPRPPVPDPDPYDHIIPDPAQGDPRLTEYAASAVSDSRIAHLVATSRHARKAIQAMRLDVRHPATDYYVGLTMRALMAQIRRRVQVYGYHADDLVWDVAYTLLTEMVAKHVFADAPNPNLRKIVDRNVRSLANLREVANRKFASEKKATGDKNGDKKTAIDIMDACDGLVRNGQMLRLRPTDDNDTVALSDVIGDGSIGADPLTALCEAEDAEADDLKIPYLRDGDLRGVDLLLGYLSSLPLELYANLAQSPDVGLILADVIGTNPAKFWRDLRPRALNSQGRYPASHAAMAQQLLALRGVPA